MGGFSGPLEKTVFLGLILRFSNLNVLHKGLLLQDWVFRLGYNVHYLVALFQETPNGQKKKIIPIGSDFEEMSPSPEFPHSPVDQTAFDKNIESVLEEVEKANLNKNKKMNFKWKSSVSKYKYIYSF